MLINTSVTVAYKCPSCGTYEFFNISIFKLLNKGELSLSCRCNDFSAAISVENSCQYRIKIGCMGCGNDHIFVLTRKELMHKNLNVFNCPQTGVQQCFIGDDAEVRRKVDSLEKELDELMDMFGYESYFKNTRVMFDSLNKVHDIAEQGNLHCECGNTDIELVLLPDRIQLKCKKCPGNKTIHAVSNEDLKNILSRRNIVLQYGIQGYRWNE